MNALKVLRLPVGQMQANCFVVFEEGVEQCLVIDPGDDADYIMRVMMDEGVKPTALIATHGHFDHIMAVNELKLAYDIPFYIHEKDEFLVERIRETARHFSHIDPGPPPKIDGYLNKTTLSHLTAMKLTVMETPGHTPGSVCLYSRKSEMVFVGDLIFAGGGIGRYDFSYSNYDQLQQSIRTTLRLPQETMVYPGHGEVTRIGVEKQLLTKEI